MDVIQDTGQCFEQMAVVEKYETVIAYCYPIAQNLPRQHGIALLKGSMTLRRNVAVYPEGYGQTGYEGPAIEAVWEDVEDLSTIERFGFTKAEILAL